MSNAVSEAETSGLRRVLGLRQLVFIGVIMIQPIAPVGIYGVVHEAGRGHVVTTVLLAMVAVLLTAVSYGRMARLYPGAGSAYLYIAREFHPALGFLAGWCLLLDYLLGPIVVTIINSQAAMNLMPAVPYEVWVMVFALFISWLNLRRIQATARVNEWLTIGMLGVVAVLLAACVRYLLATGLPTAAEWVRPFYDPATFSWGGLSTAASLAALTYIGFDGLATLSEEMRNPERDVLRAMVFTCLVIGLLSAVEVYAAQLVWPYGEPFPNLDTAYTFVAQRVGGTWLFLALNITLIVAGVGSGGGAQLAGARLLYGMAKEDALPVAALRRIDPVLRVPRNGILVIGAGALFGGYVLSYQLGAELLNFGAFLGFTGVNAAAFRSQWRERNGGFWALVPSALGVLVCFYLWWSLRPVAKGLGAVWMLAGVLLLVWQRRRE